MFRKLPFILERKYVSTKMPHLFGTFTFGQRFLCHNSKMVEKSKKNFVERCSNLKFYKFFFEKNMYKKAQLIEINVSKTVNSNNIGCDQFKMEFCVALCYYEQKWLMSNLKNKYEGWIETPFKIDNLYSLNRIHKYCLLRRNVNFLVDGLQLKTCNINSKDNVKFPSYSTIPRIFSRALLIGNYVKPLMISREQKRTCSTVSTDESYKKPCISNLSTSADNDKFYTSPKNILHNAYDVIAQECNNRDLKLQPHYNIVKEKKNSHFWCCTYYVKWPETIKFVSVGPTKQEASHKAALSTLLWLRKKGKITKEGYPVFIGKNEVKEITKTTVPNLSLDHYVLQKMNLISDIYQHEFIPKLTNSSTNEMEYHRDINELNSMEESEDNNFGKFKPKLLRNSKYFAKEKVHLPISEYKQQFINLLKHNRIVIVQGEPGCGKSTRIPQYVLEAWAQDGLLEGEHCCLAVTQPRRIAAISLADRVSSERDERCGHIVGYQVRLKSNFNPATGRILYCTTGILLRHLQSDITLSHFTHVILDEAHERDVNTDLLMNLLRNTIKINPKLKLIVMSATIDTDMFKNYFNDAAVMHIPGFTYPVKYNFIDDLIELDLSKSSKMCSNDSPNVVHEDVLKLIHYIHKKKSEGAILCFLPGWEDISKIEKSIPHSNDMLVLCLHSRLQDSDQWKIFSKAPPGVRKVILSTNIAETSVTINDVVYVIDTAIHKENRFDNAKGVVCIDNYWISQSSLIQRRGRAGRVQPGESFHLVTKSKYESFIKFTDPEILKTSLTKIVLNSKIYSNNMDALEFMSQLPSPPEKNATRRAVAELKELELLDDNENLTSLGKTLANFQLEPKLAKILVNAIVYKCVTPVVDIVTLFAANTELFATSLLNKENIKNVKSQASKDSDHLAMMRLFETWLELMEQQGGDTAEKYCSDANLVHHKLITMNKLRKIHFDYLYNGLHNALPIADDYSDNNELIKAVLLSGVGTLLKRCDWDIVKGRYKKKNVFLTSFNQKASITSESVNFKRSSFPSDLLVYFNELRSNIRRTTLIRECSIISPLAVLLFSPKNLVSREIETDNNKLILGLKDTKIEFLCTKEEAASLKNCKEALNSAYQYFIFQMTEGGECNLKINEVWNKILEHVNTILLKYNIK